MNNMHTQGARSPV